MVGATTQAVEKAYTMAREDIYTFVVIVFITLTIGISFAFYKVVSKFAHRWMVEKDAFDKVQQSEKEAYFKEQIDNSRKVVEQFENTITKIFQYLEREQTRNDSLYEAIRADRIVFDNTLKTITDKIDELTKVFHSRTNKIDNVFENVNKLHDKIDNLPK